MAISDKVVDFFREMSEDDQFPVADAILRLKPISDGEKPFKIDQLRSWLDGEIPSLLLTPTDASDAIIPDDTDEFSVWALNGCLEKFTGESITDASVLITRYNAIIKEKYSVNSTLTSLTDVRKDFYDNKYVFESDPATIAYGLFVADRLSIYRNLFVNNGGLYEFYNDDFEKEEKLFLSQYVGYSPNDSSADDGSQNLTDVQAGINGDFGTDSANQSNYASNIKELAFPNREPDTLQLNAFYRVFSRVNPEIDALGRETLDKVFGQIEMLGLTQLAGYAYEISEFTKRRFTSKTTLQAALFSQEGESALFDPKTDLPWLISLGEVVNSIKRDPVAFASINYYFPSLITFLLDAVAAVADYTNNGKGQSEEELAETFLVSFQKALGITESGKPIFELAVRASSTADRIKYVLSNAPFRENIAPASPDIFHLRLGAANFYVPPVSIDVNTAFKTGSLVGGAIRQKNTPKFNSGYKETIIRLRLFFPNYEEIWGISIDDGSSISVNENYEIDFKRGGASEEKIDKFLSSLRGLVAAFKYSPILPVKNHYINTVHGVTAVGLSGMTISTVPNFPFVLAVDLELLNFNHKPFLPMIRDFNQAIHWGKYRQYMGKAAGSLHSYVNEGFLLKTSNTKSGDVLDYETIDDEVGAIDSDYGDEITDVQNNSTLVADNVYKNDVYTQNVKREWEDGSHVVFFAPAETQTKIFLPDTSSFRTEQEKLLTDLGEDFWEKLLNRLQINIDINQSAGYRIGLRDVISLSQNRQFYKTDYNLVKDYVGLLTAGINTDNQAEKVYLTLMTSFVQQNSNKLSVEERKWLLDYNDVGDTEYPSATNVYYFNEILISGNDGKGISLNAIKTGFREMSLSPQNFLEQITQFKIDDKFKRVGTLPNYELEKEGIARAFNVALYRNFFKLGSVRDVMEARRAKYGYRFQEWEVPMIKVELDPKSVVINGVSVAIANSFAKLQLQMQDEPTYQHIGGKDSYINISMTVIGEKELIKLKSMFDHISGLARLEHATGVIGFLGIKNVITALCGIKYILPLNYRVTTKPNYPHVYDVEISMVDFDIFQQKREKLSSKQQEEQIKEFTTKKNPFLRIKQMWGTFNSYPDFPLEVKDSAGEVVGHLDPDFYFRSFEMFDRDVVNNISDQKSKVQNYVFDSELETADIGTVANISAKILEFLRQYSSLGGLNLTEDNVSLQNLIKDMRDYVRNNNIDNVQFLKIFNSLVSTNTDGFTTDFKNQLLTNFITIADDADEENPFLLELNPAEFKVGDLAPNSYDLRMAIEAMLLGEYSLENEEYVSFDPDDVDFHKLIHLFPASDPEDIANGRVSATCVTAIGTYFGYVQKDTGRFYLTTNDGVNFTKDPDSGKVGFKSNLMEDTQTPDKGNTVSNTRVPGTTPISEYQKAYKGGLYSHIEEMMVDASYRDVSGRMIRAFPTYMLWLIDEGGYFAGTKLFDNFYGLQSVIDFSVVTSEDLLGDTLILRVSNLYAKLTTPSNVEILNPNIDPEDGQSIDLIDGIEAIVERTLNFSRNVLSHMRNEYVADFSSIRLKPGVRLHLRGGYGSNPNSLQTLFNGVITNVEPGEIVTITAQSDAIELGAIINSTDKKGDSGKIDGGIDTGFWLSEPRDLMVRLLSMGASRVKEAFARAYKGTIFSENRFGIRHFGGILYQATEMENTKNKAIRDSVAAALISAGGNGSFASKTLDVTAGFSFNRRGSNMFSAMTQIWANFSAEVDLELFKRNIYPGNGTGLAQFLGGDIDDGWLTAASMVPEDTNNRVEGNLGRLTDLAWNNLVAQTGQRIPGASETLDSLTEGNELHTNEFGTNLTKFVLGGALAIPATILGGPVAGVATGLGAGLLGIISGRGGTNIFRTLGLVSANFDDDIPGFDEVSFRAQTYMRTVWDLFQTCARLLPNYIVAIRPFEDRSTVFYGKPHWLYTSGVVPVTTGYPGDDKMQELGLMEQKVVEPDQSLQEILDLVNRESNPYADFNAYFESFEKDDAFKALQSDIYSSQGVYQPTAFLDGKIINFYSEPAVNYYGRNEEVICKMPVSKGNVTVGLHLPITDNNSIEAPISQQLNIHSQLNNLPPRYRFPFFSATENIVLETNSEIAFGSTFESYSGDLLREFIQLLNIESNFFKDSSVTLKPTSNTLQLETIIDITALEQQSSGIGQVAEIVRMPLPNVQALDSISLNNTFKVVNPDSVLEEYAFEYQDEIYGQLTYSEWGSPKTAEDEQFYIAMRWPYNPDNETIREEFKQKYGFENLYGSASDYKNRKVLVYSPLTNRAVVCKPAYFMWGESDSVDAVVSPDAAYFLGILTLGPNDEARTDNDTSFWERAGAIGASIVGLAGGDPVGAYQRAMSGSQQWDSGFRNIPQKQECYMGFVPSTIPVGVIAAITAPANQFSLSTNTGEAIESDNDFLIGFGRINSGSEGSVDVFQAYGQANSRQASKRNSLEIYSPYNAEFQSFSDVYKIGGNPIDVGSNKTYFDAVIAGDYSSIERGKLIEILNAEMEAYPDMFAGGRYSFLPVSSPTDSIGVQARGFYDEDFDPSVNVIAGNGRTLDEADQIWNEFRTGYHTFDSVKAVFVQVYGLDPDSEVPLPQFIIDLITGTNATQSMISKFNTNEDTTALDEFAILLGSDYVDNLPNTGQGTGSSSQEKFKEAIEFARSNFIDAPESEGGLIEYFNKIVVGKLDKVYENFLSPDILRTVLVPDGASESDTDAEVETTNTTIAGFDPTKATTKQLFLLMVGIFRQRLWEDPYARAWLILKPNRKRSTFGIGGGDEQEGFWSFKPVDRVFREFINPYNDIAKPSKNQKFIQLLAATKSEGNSNTNIFSDAVEGIGNFFETNIGPIWTAMTDSLSALLGMFKLNLQQMGYALSEVGNFGIQANILNKALNDSIYYSLGRPGSLLRAVDNPFTREYGEPVVEVREPFQRIHYINSFSHILNNRIQENLNGVATVVTAVSDGKYPVTVALDKGAPSERQVEKTVETGLYFDNFVGSGLSGILHPFFHPLETARGVAKNISGSPDELMAKRVALAHLKESIKDIYGGELMLLGNPDIRPHDLVYIADVYERMYGIFEVEQVIHHFTPELGFITSVTPNALVSVNDPARWFISAWLDSWLNTQTIRNDTRIYLDNIRSSNSGVAVAGNLSLDALSEALSPQITGGVQFTHGSSALSRDLMANQMAQSLPGTAEQLVAQSKENMQGGVGVLNALAGGIAGPGALAAGATVALGAPLILAASPIVGQLAWKGWKWIRDNLLDQHGCYVQYLNKNGQPMDAGLSYHQGMVVGRYHTKAMLPGILGVRSKVRTPEGYAYIRSDDIFKSLGWQEKEIGSLVRYLSYENALVHARVLKLAGLGPEKAGLQPQYKIICKVASVIDGDTVKLIDCITGSNLEFNLRFTGIDTSELNVIRGKVDYSEPGVDAAIIDVSSPAGRAKVFVENALKNKLFIVTVPPSNSGSPAILESDYNPGSSANNQLSYDKDQFGRTMGTIFYYFPENVLNERIQTMEALVRNKIVSARYSTPSVDPAAIINVDSIKELIKENFNSESVFRIKFNNIYNSIYEIFESNYFDYGILDTSFGFFDETLKKVYNSLIYMMCLEWIYEKTNEWPLIGWDEYYDDGYPATLNWELVVNNLAKVYTKDLLTESESVIGIGDGIPYEVN